MSKVITCECGKSFKAPSKLAGKRVACLSCGADIQVPLPSNISTDTIHISCQCGSVLDAPVHLAGKKVKCPSCGSKLSIPSASPIPDMSADWMDDDFGGLNSSSVESTLSPLPTAGYSPEEKKRTKKNGWLQTTARSYRDENEDEVGFKLCALMLISIFSIIFSHLFCSERFTQSSRQTQVLRGQQPKPEFPVRPLNEKVTSMEWIILQR
ncbi:MAG: hypothetical protein ACKVH8_11225 [Pirellulales bacterium]